MGAGLTAGHDDAPRLGVHWLGRGAGADPAMLRDAQRVHAVLSQVAPALGLVRVAGPMVEANPDGSLVGVVLLAESHASLHVPPGGSDYAVDVFSCVDFDVQRAHDLFVAAFGGTVQGQLVPR